MFDKLDNALKAALITASAAIIAAFIITFGKPVEMRASSSKATEPTMEKYSYISNNVVQGENQTIINNSADHIRQEIYLQGRDDFSQRNEFLYGTKTSGDRRPDDDGRQRWKAMIVERDWELPTF
jgi:hypothetical protein